ncbi:MAG: ATP-binding protein [Gemmatimonadales bacterium]
MTSSTYPPMQGRVLLEQLAALIRGGPGLFAVEPVLTVRSLLAEATDGELYHYGSVVTVGEGASSAADQTRVANHPVGYVRLLEHTRRSDSIAATDHLSLLLTFWTRQEKEAFFGGFTGNSADCQWYPSRSVWHSHPCWTFSIIGERKASGQADFRNGPVLDEDLPFFAPSLEKAAATWLGQHVPAGTNRYWVVIPDLRAKLADIQVDGTKVRVTVSRRTTSKLISAIESQSYEGELETKVQAFNSNQVELELGRTPRTLAVYLHDNEKRLIDRFEETEKETSWNKWVLSPGRPLGPGVSQLQDARDTGEGQQVEFKPLVLAGMGDSTSDAKVQEIVETVVAFANAGGGSIFLGLNDYGDVSGTLAQVNRHIRGAAGGDQDRAKDLFVAELKSIISADIAPSLRLSFEWISAGEYLVLRIDVPAGIERPYHTVAQNRFFVRRGATNRPMTRDELERAFR